MDVESSKVIRNRDEDPDYDYVSDVVFVSNETDADGLSIKTPRITEETNMTPTPRGLESDGKPTELADLKTLPVSHAKMETQGSQQCLDNTTDDHGIGNLTGNNSISIESNGISSAILPFGKASMDIEGVDGDTQVDSEQIDIPVDNAGTQNTALAQPSVNSNDTGAHFII